MKCIVCGQEIPAGEAYCLSCGSPAPAGGLSYAGYMQPVSPAGQPGGARQPVSELTAAPAMSQYGQGQPPIMPQQNQGQPPFAPQKSQDQPPFMQQQGQVQPSIVSPQNQGYPPFAPQSGQGQPPFAPQPGQGQPPFAPQSGQEQLSSAPIQGREHPVPAQQKVSRYVPPSQASFMPVSEYDPYSRIPSEKNDSRTSGKEGRQKSPEQKKKTGIIIGIIAGVLVVGAALVCWMLGLFHFKNGTYIWDDYSRYGTTIELELKGDKGTLTASYSGKTDTQEVDVSFDGSTVTFTANGKRIDGIYDRKAETISVADESLLGFEIVLKKK